MFEQCVKVVVPMQDGDFIVIDIAQNLRANQALLRQSGKI